jgi:hypothetical protein
MAVAAPARAIKYELSGPQPACHFAAQLQDARKISERVPRRAVGELKVAEIGSKPQTDT